MTPRTLIGCLAMVALGFVPYFMDRLLGNESMAYYLLIWAGWVFYVYGDYCNVIRKWIDDEKSGD